MKSLIVAIVAVSACCLAFGEEVGKTSNQTGVTIRGDTEIHGPRSETYGPKVLVGEGPVVQKAKISGSNIVGNTKIQSSQHSNTIVVGKNKPTDAEPKKAD